MNNFVNREQAGQALAKRLRSHITEDTVILGVPRGGVPVAFEVAKVLNRPLDILAIKKIGVPSRPEVALGAISEDGVPYFDEALVRRLHIQEKYLLEAAQEKHQELRLQLTKFRNSRPPIDLIKKDIIVIDDGIATGATLRAAVSVLRQRGARKITLAAPVGARPALESLLEIADEVIALVIPEDFIAVGMWYQEFPQVTEKEVLEKLETLQYLDFPRQEEVILNDANQKLLGDWTLVEKEKGLIIFAHGSGSSRKSPRNQYVAKELNKIGFSTLLVDLLTMEESLDRKNVFDIDLLTQRLVSVTDEILKYYKNKTPRLAYFGASTGAAAALGATALSQQPILAVVSRGGRPDLAEKYLQDVSAPTLLIIGSEDKTVLNLNKKVQTSLKRSHLVTISGATHLFEEPGALDEVIEYAAQWFVQHLQDRKSFLHVQEQVVAELIKHSHPIKDLKSWDPLIERLSKSRIVMLGEATHGTEEFYNIRRYISQRLIQEHGYNFIAVEGDWPDCQRLNDYIHSRKGDSAEKIMKQFNRWPTWMWANQETASLIEWMKNNNASFYGLDIYSLFDSLDYLNEFSHTLDSESAAFITKLYECFENFKKDEKAYLRAVTQLNDDCSEEAIANLKHLLQLRLEGINETQPSLLNAQQNARIIARAGEYYHAMLSGGPESWNVRDRHMIETLDHLLHHEGMNSKCIVWAHNSHIGDYRATDMHDAGYVNLGGLAREKFGDQQVSLVGFGTYEGQVLAGPAWEGPEMRMILSAARPASFEAHCHKVAHDLKADRFYALFDEGAQGSILGTRQYGHRAVGVVYDRRFEEHGRNYVPTIPAKRYDAFVFVDKTSALVSLANRFSKLDLPETWPGGF